MSICRRVVPAIVLAVFAAAVGQAFAGSATDANNLYYNILAPHLGSKDKVNRNLSSPLVRGTRMTTASGQVSFDASALKASGSPLMRVSAFLNMPTGDLTGITVEQDLDFDGTLETVSVFPQNAQGRLIAAACSDGYVQCDPGTHENCQYRKWTADDTGKIGVVVAGAIDPEEQQGAVNALSGCFCFSNACSKQTNSAIINLSGVVSDIGGGIAGAMLNVRKDVAITSIQSADIGSITYYGVKSENVKGGDKSLMTLQQAAAMPNLPSPDLVQIQYLYMDSPGALSSMGDSIKEAQINDPNSLYNSGVGNALNRQAGKRFACTNLRTGTLALNHYTQSVEEGLDGGDKRLCADQWVDTILSRDSEGRFAVGWVDVGFHGIPGENCGLVPYNSTLGTFGHLAGVVNVTPPPESTGFKITKASVYLKLWGDTCASGNGDLVWFDGMSVPLVGRTGAICGGDGAQFPFYAFRLTIEYDSQDLKEELTSGCKEYEERSDCRLQQELWDGRPVYLNFLPTGFQMYQVCGDFSGPVRNTKVCRDWWKQDKVFICKDNPTTYDFSGIQQRVKEIQNTASLPSAGSLTCSDRGTPLNFQIPTSEGSDECQPVCKTKVPFGATVVTPVGIRAEQQVDPATEKDSWKIYYKDCAKSASGDYSCPVDDSIGEVVAVDCACGSDFGEAFGALSAINKAAQDSVCSKY